jgi:hypothetical protein
VELGKQPNQNPLLTMLIASFLWCAGDVLANARYGWDYRLANAEFWCWCYNDNFTVIHKAMVEQAFSPIKGGAIRAHRTGAS